MKSIILMFASLVTISVSGQITIDANVKNEYDSLFKIQPRFVKEKSVAKRNYTGFALILNWKVDTLNLNEYEPAIPDSSALTNGAEPNKKEDLLLDGLKVSRGLSCNGVIRHDTLFISTSAGSFTEGFGTLTKIFKGNSTTIFAQSNEAEIYTKFLGEKKSSVLSLATTSESILLTNLPKKPGRTLYGKLIIATHPFFEDASTFKNGCIHKKYIITFLFYCNVSNRWDS